MKSVRVLAFLSLMIVGLFCADLLLGQIFPPSYNNFARRVEFKNTPPPPHPKFQIQAAWTHIVVPERENRFPTLEPADIDYSHRTVPEMWGHEAYTFANNYRGRSFAKWRDGRPFFDVEIQTDEYGKRVTPQDHLDRRKKFILALGDSSIFGEGLQPDQTISAYLAQILPDTHSYNLAIPAAGPSDQLARLEKIAHSDEIPEQSGSAFYFLTAADIRASNPSLFFAATHRYSWYFKELPSGYVAHFRRYGDVDRVRDILYFALSQSRLLAFFDFDYPTVIGDKEYKHTARLIREMANLLKRKFNSDRFYVMISPYANLNGAMTSALEEQNLKTISYDGAPVWKFAKDPVFLNAPYTVNAGPGWNRWLAEQIVKDTGLKK